MIRTQPGDAPERVRVAGEPIGVRFDRVARRYDLLTTLNPGYGKHLRWSAERLRLPRGGEGQRLLDLCCGTGASTRALARVYPRAEIVGLDASEGMLEVARRKSFGRRVTFVAGDAMRPRESGIAGSFDAVMMAYGIRNVPDADGCLAAVRELLAPGAPVCFHEYSVRDSAVARAVWNAVTFGVIIPAGYLASREHELYRYLRRSVLDFDGVSAFEARLRAAGLEDVRTEPMDGWQRGIVHSFVARRPS
jgi:ubiquinone/menaquinone biosynthesis methyltransferase